MAEFTDDEKRSDANTAINAKLWATCQAEAKRKFKIHPSAYSNGYASKIYKERGGKWRSDSLKEWFAEDWKAINSSGKIVGGCGDGETKGKVKCLPASKARSLSKKDRSSLAKRKQKQDPNPNREGAPVMVSSKRREDAMTPEVFSRAIASIEKNYGLRLDAQSVWLRMDATPCGRGWVGTKPPGCKQVKKEKAAGSKTKATGPKKAKLLTEVSPVVTPDKGKRATKSKAIKETTGDVALPPSRSLKTQAVNNYKPLRDPTDLPLGQILRTPLRFMSTGSGPESKEKASPELVTAMKGKKNIQPIMVREKGPDSYEIISGHKTADAMKKGGADFAQVVIMDEAMEKQWRMETGK